MIPDVSGWFVTWICSRYFSKQNKKDLEGMEERLKNHMTKLFEPLLKDATAEQRAKVMSTVQNSTTAIVHALSGSVHAKSDVRGTLTKGSNVNIIDPSADEPADMGPGRTGG